MNYDLIADAIYLYKKLGYSYIDVPWLVDEESVRITIPPEKRSFIIDNQHLVGSAEQSFLNLILNDKLKEGYYVAGTPCFRDDIEDEYHQKYFFKVELINYSKSQLEFEDLNSMISDAIQVQSKFVDFHIEKIKTEEGFDLMLNGIEIGSYGIRKYKDFNWVYGTGLAEPRFSKVKKLGLNPSIA